MHGVEAVESAEKISKALFSGDVRQLTEEELVEAFVDVPSTELEGSQIGLIDLYEL